ncbi:putative leader peptide [Streptomyces kunmingensis]
MRKSRFPALSDLPVAARLFFARRHIDLARVSSAACPAG